MWSNRNYTYMNADILRWSLHPHSNHRTKSRSNVRLGLVPEASCTPSPPFSTPTVCKKGTVIIKNCLWLLLLPPNQFDRMYQELYGLWSIENAMIFGCNLAQNTVTWTSNYIKIKPRQFLRLSTTRNIERGVNAPRVLNLDTRWRVTSLTNRQFYPLKKRSRYQMDGWLNGPKTPVWTWRRSEKPLPLSGVELPWSSAHSVTSVTELSRVTKALM
jgi:hypothetical protein